MNIYTDSKYASGVVHNLGMLWKQFGFLTTFGIAIIHGSHIKLLLDTLFLPNELAILRLNLTLKSRLKKQRVIL